MAAFMGRTELGLKDTSTSATVPDNYKARLMYYFNCICTVLKMEDSDSDVSRLRDYKRYNQLTESETDQLVLLCFLVSPDELAGKCIFQDDDLCQGSANKFYELSAVRSRMLVTSDVMIGGQQRHVTSIMAFQMCWIRRNWAEPMEHFHGRLQRMTRRRESRSTSSCCIQ